MPVYQRVRYRLPDGTETGDASAAVRLTDDEVLTLARPVCRSIPPGFLLGMSIREDDRCVNESDTDLRAGVAVDTTYGLLQIRPGELTEAIRLGAKLAPDADLLDPTVNLTVGAWVLERHARQIMTLAGQSVPTRDTWLYLSWAHNAGVGEPLESIRRYGLSWPSLLKRPQNEYMTKRLIPYATAIADMAERYPA